MFLFSSSHTHTVMYYYLSEVFIPTQVLKLTNLYHTKQKFRDQLNFLIIPKLACITTIMGMFGHHRRLKGKQAWMIRCYDISIMKKYASPTAYTFTRNVWKHTHYSMAQLCLAWRCILDTHRHMHLHKHINCEKSPCCSHHFLSFYSRYTNTHIQE